MSNKTTKNTILLKGRGIRKEGEALLNITPGMLVERFTPTAVAGGAGVATVTAGDVSAGKIGFRPLNAAATALPAAKAFAVEDELHGNEIDKPYVMTQDPTTSTTYYGNNCIWEVMPSGSEVYALTPTSAASVAIPVGAAMTPHDTTNGTLDLASATDFVVGFCIKAIKAGVAGDPTVNSRIQIEVA